jgi:protein-L-isoaspartate(D-aspartate) O-methyltransferase
MIDDVRPIVIALATAASIAATAAAPHRPTGFAATVAARPQAQEIAYREARMELVELLRNEGIRDEDVLEAIGEVPRERFVPESVRSQAYGNYPLPIGHGQTISQPYIVALMSELLDVESGDRVLEIGTGSGYQAAVLAALGCEVYSVEIIGALAESARDVLEELGYADVHVLHGDGYRGWPEHAPFDAVIVTAAPEEVPDALVDQLATGGRMVIPVGPVWGYQYLDVLEKGADGGIERRRTIPVRFVPMVKDPGAE